MFTCLKKTSFVVSLLSLLALTGIPPSALAAPGDGVPFQALQAQIDELKEALREIRDRDFGDKEVTVNCVDVSIADALMLAGSAKRVIITVTGQCNETVNLTRDDVTLLGGSGTITGSITLDGAHRIVIDGLTLLGGIAATRGATVLIQNSMIDVGSDVAILVNHGSFAEIVNNPLIRSDLNCAVQASDGGEVRMQGNPMVQSNQISNVICSTLGLFRRGLARLRGGNTFVNDVGGDVFTLNDGSVMRQDGGVDSFRGNGLITRMSNAEMRSAQFAGNSLEVGHNSSVRFRNSAVSGELTIYANSDGEFSTNTTLNGKLSIFGTSNVVLLNNTTMTGPMEVGQVSTLLFQDSVLNGQLQIYAMANAELNQNTVMNGFISVLQNSNVLVRPGNTVNGDIIIGKRSQAFFDFDGIGGTVNGNIICDVATSPRNPFLGLQLVDSVFRAPIVTTQNDFAFAYRGAVVGQPLGTVSFSNCN